MRGVGRERETAFAVFVRGDQAGVIAASPAGLTCTTVVQAVRTSAQSGDRTTASSKKAWPVLGCAAARAMFRTAVPTFSASVLLRKIQNSCCAWRCGDWGPPGPAFAGGSAILAASSRPLNSLHALSHVMKIFQMKISNRCALRMPHSCMMRSFFACMACAPPHCLGARPTRQWIGNADHICTWLTNELTASAGSNSKNYSEY